jgi:hypothetical protein
MLADLFTVSRPDLDYPSENSNGAIAPLARAPCRKFRGAAPPQAHLRQKPTPF